MATITVPDFPFSGHYYSEILEDLIQFLRTNAPEITDEDPTEPAIQLLRAYALSAHLNNVLLDVVANECFLPTSRIRANIANLLALIDFRLKQASPAVADILYQLTKTFAVTTTICPKGSLFATQDTRASKSIEYEVLADKTTIRTDLVDKVYSFDASGNAYADHTAEAQSSGGSFSPGWSGGPAAGDILYIGHPDVLWNQVNVFITTPGTNITIGVWEYYDGNLDQDNPTSVVNLGSTLEFNVNQILGTSNRAGAKVRVRSNLTGAFEDVISTFSGGVNKVVTSFLGQSVPSTTATDYIVGTAWRELTNVVDNTINLTAAAGERTVTFDLPQSITKNWRTVTDLDPALSAILLTTQYWLRFRVVTATGGGTIPAISEIQIHKGKQYQVAQATQGRTRADNPLASSTGLPDQEYSLTSFPVLDDTNLKIFVNEGVEQQYTKVTDFLSSASSDRHFIVAFDDDGIATITFGNGTNGKIPPAGVNNIRAEYRIMDDSQDGNVGANMIVISRSGIAFISSITNPRAASGYAVREGTTDEDKERIKAAGPASLRTKDRAISPPDIETIAAAFVSVATGARPFVRALAIEESFGPKTVECVVVGTGGVTVISSLLQELEDYFNGSGAFLGQGVVQLNSQIEVTNFVPKTINVTATVEGGSLTAIQTALTALLNPAVLDSDGNFVWKFGGEVARSKLIQTIMNTVPAPRDVTLAIPAADVALATRELPVVGTLTLTVLP